MESVLFILVSINDGDQHLSKRIPGPETTTAKMTSFFAMNIGVISAMVVSEPDIRWLKT